MKGFLKSEMELMLGVWACFASAANCFSVLFKCLRAFLFGFASSGCRSSMAVTARNGLRLGPNKNTHHIDISGIWNLDMLSKF